MIITVYQNKWNKGVFIVSVATLVKFLQKNGWTVEAPGKRKGESGILHEFPIIAYKNKQVITLDLEMQTSKIECGPIIRSFVKKLDVKPDASFFIAIPGMEEDALKLSAYYSIKVVEGKTIEEAVSKFESLISVECVQ